MIQLYDTGVYLLDRKTIIEDNGNAEKEMVAAKGVVYSKEECRKNTMAYSILNAHNTSGNTDKLKIRFDAIASHDITYVGIIHPPEVRPPAAIARQSCGISVASSVFSGGSAATG